MSRLKQKQRYYFYGMEGWTYKDPPSLSDEVRGAMKDKGLEQAYRFTWCGVAIYRREPGDTHPDVKGDLSACKMELQIIDGIEKPMLVPKERFAQARQPKAFMFSNDAGEEVRTYRPDLLPTSVVCWPEYVYVDYGKLVWITEQHLNREQCITSGLFTEKTAPDEYWQTIKNYGISGIYEEPTIHDVHHLAKRHFENRNRDLNKIGEETKEREEKRKQDIQDNAEFLQRDAFNQWFDKKTRAIQSPTTRFPLRG